MNKLCAALITDESAEGHACPYALTVSTEEGSRSAMLNVRYPPRFVHPLSDRGYPVCGFWRRECLRSSGSGAREMRCTNYSSVRPSLLYVRSEQLKTS